MSDLNDGSKSVSVGFPYAMRCMRSCTRWTWKNGIPWIVGNVQDQIGRAEELAFGEDVGPEVLEFGDVIATGHGLGDGRDEEQNLPRDPFLPRIGLAKEGEVARRELTVVSGEDLATAADG